MAAAARYDPEIAAAKKRRFLKRMRESRFENIEYLEKIGGEYTGAAKMMTPNEAFRENRDSVIVYAENHEKGIGGKLIEWVLPRRKRKESK